MTPGDVMTKLCTKCGDEKPTTAFGKDSSKRDGLHSSCRSCDSIAGAKYRAANPEKRKAINYKWASENRDKMKAAYEKWAAANPDSVKAANAKWAANNREALRLKQHIRRARERKVGGKLSRGLSDRLFKLQRGKCACCGEPLGTDFHLDHIMPLALGGSNTDDNIQLLRASCNRQKQAKHPVYFMQQRGFLL